MNKKNYYLLGGIIVLVILIIVLVLIKGKQSMPEIQQANNNEPLIQNEATTNAPLPPVVNQVETKISTTTTPKSVATYTKEIAVEFMTDAEKEKIGLPTDIKVQVLQRDDKGKISAYKIIYQDSDVITKYGN